MSSTVVAALIGVVLGGVVSSFGYWYRVRSERIARINEALFLLFEFYRIIVVSTSVNYRRALATMYRELEFRFPEYDRSQEPPGLDGLIGQLCNNVLQSQEVVFDERFSERFSSACASIASYSPLLASRINGKSYLRAMIPELEKYYGTVREAAEAEHPAEALKELDEAMEITQGEIYKKILKQLRSDILALAARCSVTTWIQCHVMFWKHRGVKLETKYEELVRELVAEFIEVNGNRLGQNQS